MRYDPINWKAFTAGRVFDVEAATFHVKLVEPGALYLRVGEEYQLIGYGHEFKCTVPDVGRTRLRSDKDGVAYVSQPSTTSAMGEPFTNAEKLGLESPLEAMIKAALRKQNLEEATKRKRAKRAHDAMQRERQAAGLQDTAPAVEMVKIPAVGLPEEEGHIPEREVTIDEWEAMEEERKANS